MQEGVQRKFDLDTRTNEFIAPTPISEGEVIIVDSRHLVREAVESIRQSKQEFYDVHPELRGDKAYYSWLAQASDY